MKVVIIGSGNIASVLGKLIIKGGHQVLQVVGHTKESSALLSKELDCPYILGFKGINTSASLYIFAVPDAALGSLGDKIQLKDAIAVHTAGAVSMDTLNKVSAKNGVIYPLQSLKKENLASPVSIPLLIDGSDEKTFTTIADFANSLSSDVSRSSDLERLKLHLVAVVVNNFTNHLYTLAADFCEREKINFNKLQPLIEETAHRIQNHSPRLMQTGPAIRNDQATIKKHLQLLENDKHLKSIYLKMTESITEAYKDVLPAR